MRTSCIEHPKNETLIVIRKWQLEFCEGDRIAATLLSFFEYWHNIKIEQSYKNKQSNDISEGHHEKRTQDESLLQFHTEKELEDGTLIWGKTAIAKALAYLQNRGVLMITKNPNPRFYFDKTRFFLFKPEIINDWLDVRKRGPSLDESGLSSTWNGLPLDKNGRAIPEITTEISSERKEKEKENIKEKEMEFSTNEITSSSTLPKLPEQKEFQDMLVAMDKHRREYVGNVRDSSWSPLTGGTLTAELRKLADEHGIEDVFADYQFFLKFREKCYIDKKMMHFINNFSKFHIMRERGKVPTLLETEDEKNDRDWEVLIDSLSDACKPDEIKNNKQWQLKDIRTN